MSITVKWDDAEKTIIHYKFDGDWTWDELFITINKDHIMQDTVHHRVDMIFDMGAAPIMPPGDMAQYRHFANTRHPNTRICVVVGASNHVSTTFNTFARNFRKAAEQYRFAHDFDEAYDIIAEARVTIKSKLMYV